MGVYFVSVNQWFKQLLSRQNEEAGMSRKDRELIALDARVVKTFLSS